MGIVIAFHFQLSTIYLYIIILAAVIGILYISYFKRYFSSFSKRWIFGILINLLFVVFGVLITQQHKPVNKHFHFEKYSASASIVVLKEDIVAKTKSYKCEVEVIAVKSGNNWQNTEGKAILDFININCKQVIIDSSVPKYKWEQIKKECLKWDIPFYNVSTEGAYLFELNSS